MKKLLIPFFLILFGYIQAQGQVPDGFNYQAVARDASGNVRSNETILVRFTLQPGVSAAPTWIETQSAQTDGYGVFTLIIGAGTKTGGTASSFTAVDFSGGDYWIMVEVKDGSNYVIVGSLQKFLSVPFALISNKTLNNDDADADSTNELQILKLSNDTMYLERGGFVYLGGFNDKIEIQMVKNKLTVDSNYLKGLINTNTTNINNETNSRIAVDQSLKTKQVSDSTYLKGLISTETTNRSNTDITLQSNITTETNTRISGDNSIRSKMTTDSNAIRTIVNTTNSNLTAETNSRISGDQSLKTKQVSDSTYLKGLISTETTNRSNTDITLQSNITTETNTRFSGDNSIRSKMTTDSNAIRTIVNTTNNNLTAETNSRISGDQSLKSKQGSDSTYLKGLITTETTNRSNTDITLQSNITNETNARISGDSSIQSRMSADSNALRTIVNTTNNNLTTETNSRITGDQNLKSKQGSDSTYLEGLITAETTNLSNTDITLQSNITNETNARISGDSSIQSRMSADSNALRTVVNTTNNNLTTETNSRITGDQDLKSKQGSDSTYLEGLITAETTNRSNTDITLQSNITTETNARISGDNSIWSKLSADSTSLITKVNTTNTNLTNEINTRITADNNLKTKEISDSSYLTGLISIEANSRISGDKWISTGSNIYFNTGNVSIGSTAPNASAALDITSTTKGLLLPRMTQAQRDAITPVEGLVIFNTTTKKANYFDSIEWRNFDGSTAHTFVIGGYYRGGILAYIFQSGDPGYVAGQIHGLIVASSHQSTGIQWYNGSFISTFATAIALGTGNANTNTIVTIQGAGSYAAKICADLVLNGYSDWYLPSKDELGKLYLNKSIIGGFLTNGYWSSSENNASSALAQDFNNGNVGAYSKDVSVWRVRAIRSF